MFVFSILYYIDMYIYFRMEKKNPGVTFYIVFLIVWDAQNCFQGGDNEAKSITNIVFCCF